MDNIAVRSLAADSAVLHAPIGGVTAKHMHQAQRTLMQFALSASLEGGGPCTKLSPVEWSTWDANTSRNHHAAQQSASADDLAYLRELNRWDVALYEEVRRRQCI